MKKNSNVWLAMILFLISCGGEERPEGVFDKKEMADIMLDMYEVETFLSANRSELTISELSGQFYERVFRENGITDSAFQQSLLWYLEHPRELNQVYDIILDSAKLRQQIRVSDPENLPRADSLSRRREPRR